MHLTNAMVSPAVAGVCGVVAAGALTLAARRVRASADDRTLRDMAALGALVFALQMVDVAIPGTGSSGHIGGGVLLAMLLGPHAGLLTMAAVLAVQAGFGDGGWMALGANIVNLGVMPCLVAAPLLARGGADGPVRRGTLVAIVACMIGLQLGALGVVAEAGASGTAAPALLAGSLLPIHLPVGFVEGLFTATVVLSVRRVQRGPDASAGVPLLGAIAAVAIAIGGGLTWFGSTLPDGLEWSLAQAGSAPMRSAATAWPQVDAAASALRVAGVLTTLALVGAIARALQLRGARISR